MAAYKDEQRGTWYVSFHYYDWTGKNCRKVKRSFKTKREATEWEHHFRMKEAAALSGENKNRESYVRTPEYEKAEPAWIEKEKYGSSFWIPFLIRTGSRLRI